MTVSPAPDRSGPVHVLVVAAGRGVRAGPGGPKQYRALAGETVLRRTLAAVLSWPGVSPARVRVAIHPDDADLYADAAQGIGLAAPVHGGATRQESVRLGLEAIAADGEAGVALIHDAARPFADAALAGRVLAALERASGACPALPVVDTLRRGTPGGPAGEGVARAGLMRAQTPQGFRLPAILAAHRAAAGGAEATDDVAVVQAAGEEIEMVEGDEANLKLTTPADFARAETWLRGLAEETRVGTGFDVHAFAPGDSLWLCGIEIPFDRSLAGHSDADVGMHALTDAIFGARGTSAAGSRPPTRSGRAQPPRSSCARRSSGWPPAAAG